MKRVRILVVEDEGIVAADIKDALEHLGYEVVATTNSGEEAIRLAEELKPTITLMDIQLKGEIDGVQAAGVLRDRLNIPVVYLTAHADEATLARAKVTEPYGYIVKPFEEVELRVALELALYKHQSEKPNSLEEVPFAPERLPEGGDIESIVSVLEHIPPFQRIPQEGLTQIAQSSRKRRLDAGQLVFFEGDAEVDGFIVLSGRVALLKTSSSGRELIVELLPPGDPFGLILAIDSQSYELTAKAQTQTEVLSISRQSLVRLVDRYPELYGHFVAVVSKRLRRSHNLSRALAHDRVEVRIASALSALIPHFGVSGSQMEELFEIPITRQELADLTGTTVETAIRATKAMERSGVLDLSSSGLIRVLDRESLVTLAEE